MEKLKRRNDIIEELDSLIANNEIDLDEVRQLIIELKKLNGLIDENH